MTLNATDKMSLEEFIKLARENLALFSRRYKRYAKKYPKEFPLDGDKEMWIMRYQSHIADLEHMRKGVWHET